MIHYLLFLGLVACVIYLFKSRIITLEIISRKKVLVSIEGNIGTGKTSLIHLLQNRLHDIEFIKEPVDEWHTIVDDDGKDILQTFYDDKKRWSYTFQNIGYITRMNHIVDRIINYNKKICSCCKKRKCNCTKLTSFFSKINGIP